MNWKPGDQAIVAKTRSHYNGMIVTIIAVDVEGMSFGHRYQGHMIDVPAIKPSRINPTGNAIMKPEHLLPIDKKYDGNTTTSWAECPWHPEAVSS